MGIEIAIAIGLTGLAATAVGTAINVGISLALSYGAQTLRGKPGRGGNTAATGGVQASLQVEADTPRVAILGEAAVYGALKYWHLSGANNTNLAMVIALADHECDGLSGVIVDGTPRALDGENVATFGNKLRVRFYSGAPGQTADADVIAGGDGRWTTDSRGTGVCYAVVFAEYDQAVFPGGIPKIQFVVRGARLTDPRTGAVAYSDNWGVAVYNLIRGISQGAGGPLVVGIGASAAAIRTAEAIAACNISDELVTRSGDRPAERRYRVGCVLHSDQTRQQQLETVLAAGGSVVESGGVYRILPAVAQAPVAHVTDDDVIVARAWNVSYRRTRAQLVNAVEAVWLDRARAHVQAPLPPRSASADVATDGGVRLVRSLDLTACPSHTQAQRLMEIERRRARRQLVTSCTVRAAYSGLEVGDWITVTSTRHGWVNRVFEVQGVEIAPDRQTTLTLAETDAAIDDWSVDQELPDNAAVNLDTGGPSFAGVAGLAVANYVATGGDGATRPGLRITWTPVTDPTTVSLAVQYRRVGDTVAVDRAAPDPRAGALAWLDGVQGGARYEVRVRPVTQPERGTSWSPWMAAVEAAAPQVVAVAATVTTIDPAQLPPPLTPQERFELSLASSISDVNGSVAELARSMRAADRRAGEAALDGIVRAREAQRAAAAETDGRRAAVETERVERITGDTALGQRIDTVVATAASNAAAITAEATARANGDTALASQITTVSTTVGSQSSAITVLQQSEAGRASRWSLQLTSGNYVAGAVTLDGTGNVSTFGVLADTFVVAQPGVVGGAPVTPFVVGAVAGVPRIGIAGDMIVDGSIQARSLSVGQLSAITSDLGEVLTGLVRDAGNTIRFDLTNKRLHLTDGSMDIDFVNKRIRMVA